ncbi:hypothetical protein OAL01_03555 [Rubripirellula sp.]|nr:hypothetical protein [Rubripirellula sp.]
MSNQRGKTMDLQFANDAGQRYTLRKDRDYRAFVHCFDQEQVADLITQAWNDWPAAWKRAVAAWDSGTDTDATLIDLGEALDNLVQAVQLSNLTDPLEWVANQYDPSPHYGTTDEQDADAVKLLSIALLAIHGGESSLQVARQLLSLEHRPALGRGNLLKRCQIACKTQTPHCEGCSCIQPPRRVHAKFCEACEMEGKAVTLAHLAAPPSPTSRVPNGLQKSITKMHTEIEQVLRNLELWVPGMTETQAVKSLIGYLSNWDGNDAHVTGAMPVRLALEHANQLISSIERIKRKNESNTNQPAAKHQKSLKQLERETPELDIKSADWIAAKAKNEKKFGVKLGTLSDNRSELNGGWQLSWCFGVDNKDRRWRRDAKKTEKSTVYYWARSLKNNR